MDFLDFHHHQPNKTGIYNLALKEEIPDGTFSVGLHPKDISESWKQDFERIKTKSLSENCLAIGECGLDGLIAVPEDLQQEVFKSHIAWAEEIRKPLIIHCVRRFSQLLQFKNTQIPMVIHGFNKKESIAIELLDAGYFLSFGYAALENLSLQKIITNLPIQRLFLETDDSDFEISSLYQKVAELKSVSLQNLKNQMWENLDNIVRNG